MEEVRSVREVLMASSGGSSKNRRARPHALDRVKTSVPFDSALFGSRSARPAQLLDVPIPNWKSSYDAVRRRIEHRKGQLFETRRIYSVIVTVTSTL